MKTFIQSISGKAYRQLNLIISGALLFGMFQVPFLPDFRPMPKVERVQMTQIAEVEQPVQLAEIFFGQESTKPATTKFIDEKVAYVSSRNAFSASLAVIKKHADTIKAVAREKGVPEDVAIGVALLENGGSETAVSKAGALGVFQLMPGTARSLGLTVTKKVDERREPNKNIEAGISYLKMNYERFGDWGLATWAYHAGEGNVSKALKLYAKAHGTTLTGLKNQSEMKKYVEKNGITVHKLLSSPAVKSLTKKLNDDSAGYPYKVIATSKLFRDSAGKTSVVPGLIVDNS